MGQDRRHIRPEMMKFKDGPPAWAFLLGLIGFAAIIFFVVMWIRRDQRERDAAQDRQAAAARALDPDQQKNEAPETRFITSVIGDLESSIKQRNEASRRLEDLSALDFSKPTVAADIAPRRDAAQSLILADRDVIQSIDETPQRLEEALRSANWRDRDLKDTLNSFRRETNRRLAARRAFFAADAHCAELMIQGFDVLDSELGRWRSNGSVPVFQSQSAAERYNSLLESQRKAATELETARAEMEKYEH